MKTVIHQSRVKAFLKLYHDGRGISNNELKKIVPAVYLE